MPDLNAARAGQAKAQAELIHALVSTGPPPRGFSPAAIEQQRAALIHKRRRQIERSHPSLVRTLGRAFDAAFAEYATQQAMRTDRPDSDGNCFERWLVARGYAVPRSLRSRSRFVAAIIRLPSSHAARRRRRDLY